MRESIRLGWRHGLWYLPKNVLVFSINLPEGVAVHDAERAYAAFLRELERKGHTALAALLVHRLILEAR